MSDQRIFKAVSDLAPGDVLSHDIGSHKELKAGVILDSDSILLLRQLGISEVAVFATQDADEARKLKSGVISRQISERIDELLNQSKFGLKKESDLEDSEKGENDEVLGHIRQSREDIRAIESGEKVSLNAINEMMDRNISGLEAELKRILLQKLIEPKRLEAIVEEFIGMTGPKRDASLLLLGIVRKGTNIVIKHAVNSCLLSLAIAIEMTKIMNDQLQKPEVMGDQKKMRICNAKIFNREELIKLGVAAILHDLGLVDVFPDIREDTKITESDIARLHLHPSRAFSFLSARNLDFDIRKAILQHHERTDGSGYPDGIEKRLFSKYSLVLSFANYFDLRTTKNPFERKSHPQKALMEIIQKERKAFDDDVLFAFCRAASLYPVGSWVILSDDSVGLVIRSNHNDLRKPVLKIVYSPDLKELTSPKVTDLSRSSLTIKDVIDVETIEIFDPRYERFIFDEREFTRADVKIAVQLSIIETDVRVNGVTENISAGGMQIKSALSLSRGQHLKCDFEFRGRSLKDLFGLVVWSKSGANASEFFYGIRFLALESTDHSFLLQAVRLAN
jgi:HD-GYP domain-containing protein (c-di-GMP phosphodiesterase class II)